jgi:hypothetical protein
MKISDHSSLVLVAKILNLLAHLEVALAALVTNGAVQGVVDEQKLHDAFASFARERRVGLDAPTLHDRHGAGRDGLHRLFNLDEAHAAVSRHAESVVVTKPRDFHANHRSSLEKERREPQADA